MFDLIFRHALLVDGTGNPGWRGDLAVIDGRIAAMSPSLEAEALREVKAENRLLCPGFIDPHSHWDATHLAGDHAMIKLRQGVCLDLVGNCGESLAPCSTERCAEVRQLFPDPGQWVRCRSFGDYTREIDRARPGLRVMSHVGHGTLRIQAMGHAGEPADVRRLTQMRNLLNRSLEEGAAGLSTGLYYTPSGYARHQELVALMQIVAAAGGFHASHIRNEANNIIDALHEVIAVGRETGCPTHISHLKLAGRRNWHKAEEVVQLFEASRAEGIDLTCDVYPYHHSCTTLLSLVPPWAMEGGLPGFFKRCEVRSLRQEITDQIREGMPGWESGVQNSGFAGITISSVRSKDSEKLVGKSLAECAAIRDLPPEQLVIELIRSESGDVNIICASMNEDVVARFLKLPFAMIGSDGALNQGKPHPRAFGAFPRVFRRFVREKKILTLEEAVAKMTALPARRLGLEDCGRLAPGLRADLVLFDPATFGDTATFDEPRQYPTGLEMVLIEGRQAWPPLELQPVPGGFLAARHSPR